MRTVCKNFWGRTLLVVQLTAFSAFGAWPTETVATGTTGVNNVSIPVALAYRRVLVDRTYEERIFVAYYHRANANLVVASRDSTGLWTQSTIESSGTIGLNPDIAIDSTGNPHVVYKDATNSRFRYARRVTSGGNCGPLLSWSCENIPLPGGSYADQDAKIIIASDGRIHVSYNAALETGFRFAYLSRLPAQPWTAVEWVVPPVATPWARLMSLDLDSSKSPHLGFLAPTSITYRAFQWARKVNGAWVTEAAPGNWNSGGRMVLGSDNHPRACLNMSSLIPGDNVPTQVHRGVRNTDGTWTTSLHINNGSSCAITVSGAQSYRRFAHGGTDGMLYYSQEMPLNPGTYFTLELVWAGTAPDIALDYQGKALLAYSYPNTGTVFFSRQP